MELSTTAVKEKLTDYAIRKKVQKETFYFRDDTFCPNCGNKGIWCRHDFYKPDEPPHFCLHCNSIMFIGEQADIIMDNEINQLILSKLRNKEFGTKKKIIKNQHAIKSLELI